MTSQIAVPDESYVHLRRLLDQGKKAYLVDKFGKKDRVKYDGLEMIEVSSKRTVISLDSLKNKPLDLLTNYAKLVLQFDEPVERLGSLTRFEKGLMGAVYDAESDEVKYYMSGQCWACPEPSHHRCGKCNLARYCSPKCQASDWGDHKSLCFHI